MSEYLFNIINERFTYRDGGLWVKTRYANRVKIGSRAGSKAYKGYRRIGINGKEYKEHTLVWIMHYGKFPTKEIDHINGIKTDNRIENLRECTSAENKQNLLTAHRDNKTGFLGVIKLKNGRYRAAIRKDGKQISLGNYGKAEEAHKAYLDAKKVYHIQAPK